MLQYLFDYLSMANRNRVILGRDISLDNRTLPSASPLEPAIMPLHQDMVNTSAIVRSYADSLIPVDTPTMIRLDGASRPVESIEFAGNRQAMVKMLEEADGGEYEKPKNWTPSLDMSVATGDGEQEVEARFEPEERTFLLTGHLHEGVHVHVHVLEGTGGVHCDGNKVEVSHGVSAVEISLVAANGKELAHGTLVTDGVEHELKLMVHEEKEHEGGELDEEALEAIHSLLEGEEFRKKQEERMAEALEEMAEAEREHAAEEMEHAKHHHHAHEHEHHHHHEHEHHHEHHHEHEHEEVTSLDAKFNDEDRTISLNAEGHEKLFVEVQVEEGEGTLTKTETMYGFAKYTVPKGVKKVKILVKDAHGKVIVEGTIDTSGGKSELHKKTEGHGEHGKEGHKDEHKNSPGMNTPKEHHAPEEERDGTMLVLDLPAPPAPEVAVPDAPAAGAAKVSASSEIKEESSLAKKLLVGGIGFASALGGLIGARLWNRKKERYRMRA